MSGRCIFCTGNGRLSKEHIFPQWLGQHIISGDDAHTEHKTTLDGGEPQLGKLHRPVDFHKQTLRVVCESCNNGWMSRLQSLAKPHLEPLLNGDWNKCGRETYRVVATWATMFSMVYEFSNPKSETAPKEERYYLKKYNSPPATWNIWLGRHHRGYVHPAMVNHHGHKLVRLDLQTKDITLRQSLQTTGFTVGELFIQTFMASPIDVVSSNKVLEFSERFDIVKIFPFDEGVNDGLPMTKYKKRELISVSNYIAKSYGITMMENLGEV